MEEPNVSQVSSFPPPPMHYISMYTDDNVLKHVAPPPPPPIQGHYSVFGVVHNTEDPIIQPLEAHGIRRLYATSGQNQQPGATQADKKGELKKLNHSILASYLDLLELLIRCPMNQSDRDVKLDELQLLFINFHHLVNEYRPHQARETLKLMLQVQAQERLNIVRRFQRHFEMVYNNLKECLQEIPDDILSLRLCQGDDPVQISNQTDQVDASVCLESIPKRSAQQRNEQRRDWIMCGMMDDGGVDDDARMDVTLG